MSKPADDKLRADGHELRKRGQYRSWTRVLLSEAEIRYLESLIHRQRHGLSGAISMLIHQDMKRRKNLDSKDPDTELAKKRHEQKIAKMRAQGRFDD